MPPEVAPAPAGGIPSVQRLRRTRLEVVRRLGSGAPGDHASPFHGPGTDLAGVRAYQPGDEVRHIDWNVTARLGEPHVRQFQAERQLTAWLLVDRSPSFLFGTARQLKRDQAIEFAAAAAGLLTHHGDRVGLIGFGHRVDLVVPPGAGRRQEVRILEALRQTPPADAGGTTDLAHVLEEAGRAIRRRSLVFLVSDFISAPGWERPLALLSRRHDLVAVPIEDPAEIELPNAGPLRFEDPETGQQLWVDTSDKGVRRRYHEAAQKRRAEIQAILRRHRVDTLWLSTAEPIAAPLLRFASLRKRRKQWNSSGH
jgi:uncharacterized protein (DUF58 family)